jgi:flagellar hook assembly protein FlgD
VFKEGGIVSAENHGVVGSIITKDYSLSQNYPNPFNSQTTISYYLPTLSDVKIEIYNILGQKIWESFIYDQAPGKHKIVWDGENGSGNSLPSGLYFYKITTQKFSQSKKLLILR